MIASLGANGLSGVQVTPPAKPAEAAVIDAKEAVSPQTEEKPALQKSKTVEQYVRSYFSDIPVMVEIARCESRFRQHDATGEVLRGEQNSLDRGVMQINEYYHGEDSQKLGYDILTLEGNTAYARYIYDKYGVQPWSSSFPCWGKTAAYSEYSQKIAMN